MTVDMLTVNRVSAIPGRGITGDGLTTFKEAQVEIGWAIGGVAVGERGRQCKSTHCPVPQSTPS